MSALLLLGWIELALITALAAAFVLSSLIEGERRAAGVAAGISVPLVGLLALFLLLDAPARQWVVFSALLSGVALLLLCTVPFGARPALRVVGEQQRVDERDALFHRFYRLEPGTPEFESYYREHPDKLELDQEIRALPALYGPGSRTYHPATSPLIRAAFDLSEQLAQDLDAGVPASREGAPVELSADEASRRIKGFARHLGADLVGCTRLSPAYVYSHVGRGAGPWGAPISLSEDGHGYAVAIAVEMQHKLLRQAPRGPTILETAVRYLDAAKIALGLARYLNLLGYRSRAHVDSNYRVMCVPVAVDAGLGELGRLGLLITPRFGPRVRLAVVTTDLPLAQDAPVTFGVQRFCAICSKCALNCPSGSIDGGDKSVHRGVEKWISQQDSCYHTWRRCGSDCAICVKVCPYSHPNGLVHDLVRWSIRNNPAARRLALWGDDLAYGRRPKRRYPLAPWLEEGTGR